MVLHEAEFFWFSSGNTVKARRNYLLRPFDFPSSAKHYWMTTVSAGDFDAALDIVEKWPEDMLDLDASPSIYPITQHPSFDGLRERSDYVALIEKHRHWVE
jgi:hypothetical protein